MQKLHWMGHPVKDQAHARKLELKAAVAQFHHGKSRAEAEAHVKRQDRIERHHEAAAHHLQGMRASNAIGNFKDARRHHAMYELHLRAVGLNPTGAVPHEVSRLEAQSPKKAYVFRNHPDDHFLVQPLPLPR